MTDVTEMCRRLNNYPVKGDEELGGVCGSKEGEDGEQERWREGWVQLSQRASKSRRTGAGSGC